VSAASAQQRADRPLQAALQRSIDIYSLLRSVPILRQLAVEPLVALAERMQIQSFGQGQTIFQQGDPGDALYLIARGQVQLVGVSGSDFARTPAIAYIGDFFGVLALLDDGQRLNSAIAMHPTITLMLKRGVPPAPARAASPYRCIAGRTGQPAARRLYSCKAVHLAHGKKRWTSMFSSL
jgi:CRP/FNR family transcriptional regulator